MEDLCKDDDTKRKRAGTHELRIVPENAKKKKIRLNSTVEDFTCAICMESVISPVFLTCSHMYCMKCIEDLTTKGGDTCPLCKSQFLETSRFVVNKVMDQIVKGFFKDDKEYQERVKEINRERFIKLALTVYEESKRFDDIKCKILDYLFDDCTGFKHYNDLTQVVLSASSESTESSESPVSLPELYSPDRLLEYQYVLKTLIQSDELILVDEHIIDVSCIDEFMQFYREKFSEPDLLYLLAVIGNHDFDTMEEVLLKYKKDRIKQAPLNLTEEGEKEMDKKVVVLPEVVKAIGITYTKDIFGLDQDRFNKILKSLKAKYDADL
jgi:hypothetical protein